MLIIDHSLYHSDQENRQDNGKLSKVKCGAIFNSVGLDDERNLSLHSQDFFHLTCCSIDGT